MSPTEAVKTWLKDFVIKHNLCPFAAAPFHKNIIRFVEISDIAPDKQLAAVKKELLTLKKTTKDNLSTTLVIFTEGFRDFTKYNDFLQDVDDLTLDLGLEGVIQAASFHPKYLFAGENPDSNSHYTNRSPYPLIHLIREEEITLAKSSYPSVNEIPSKNIKKMDSLKGADLKKNLKDLQ